MRRKKVMTALLAAMMSVSMAVPTFAATSPAGSVATQATAGIIVKNTIRLDNNGRAKYNGTLSRENNYEEYYKFTPGRTGTLKIVSTGSNYYVSNSVREEFTNDMLSDYPGILYDTAGYSLTRNYALVKGATYLIGIRNHNRYGTANDYTIAFEFKGGKESFSEDYSNENEDMSSAKSVQLNKTYYGVKTITENTDWFKFTLRSDSEIQIPLTGDISCDIYNSSRIKEVDSYQEQWYGLRKVSLKKGTYYIRINGSGQYSFFISDGKQSSVGTGTKPSNTKPSKTNTVKVTKPKATYITKLSKGSKRFKVSVKKQSVTGYQVQYFLKSNFKGSKTKTFQGTSCTVKKLKAKKKYYVRVRSYKKSGSKTLYSAWSAKKSVKTKK